MRFRVRSAVKDSLRAKALYKLTQLPENYTQRTSQSEIASDEQVDSLQLLAQSLPLNYSSDVSKLYTIPLTISEWEVLMSLSQSLPPSKDKAALLLQNVISAYFLESPRQRVSDILDYRFKMENLKHPNEILTFQLTQFLIKICSVYPDMTKTCLKLIEHYLDLIVELLNVKMTSEFSLIGFINAFIQEGNGTLFTVNVWKKLIGLFKYGKILLHTEPHYSNEIIVRYHEANREISNSHILNLIAHLHVALTCRLLEVPEDMELGEYLLGMQYKSYQIQQEEETSEDAKKSVETFFAKFNESRKLLLDMCDFAFEYCEDNKVLDLSNDTRAQFSFDIKGYFIEFLMLVPFCTTIATDIGSQFSSLVSDSIDKFLLSDLVSSKLIRSIICAASLLNFFTEKTSLTILRMFPLLVSSSHCSTEEVAEYTKIFTLGLKPLNEDAVVSTVYSINNLLTMTDNDTELKVLRERKMTLSSISNYVNLPRVRASTTETLESIGNKANALVSGVHTVHDISAASYHSMLFKNCVVAALTIASYYNDQSITALTISILTQKVNVVSRDLDVIIGESLAKLASKTTVTELELILKFYNGMYSSAVKQKDEGLRKSVQKGRLTLSEEIFSKCFQTDLYTLVLADILDSITSCGEVEKSDHDRSHTEISHFAEQIVSFLDPLAALLPQPGHEPLSLNGNDNIIKSFRNIWFNMVIHGFYYDSDLVKDHYSSLLAIAFNTPPLASDSPASNKEVSLDMNAVLRRSSSNANHKRQKQAISKFLSVNPVQAKTLSAPKIMFLAATVLLETMRCDAGDCSKILSYYCDPSTVTSGFDKSINIISQSLIQKYTALVQANNPSLFGSRAIAKQLNDLILCLSHRNTLLQNAAFQCCDRFIKSIPSSLCHHHSLFTLLDLMTALFDSIVDCETNKFEPHYQFVLKHSKVKILLPDSANWRKATLNRLHISAKEWLRLILNKANDDTKILLQSYISDLGQFSRIESLEYGVSFAISMAGSIVGPDRELSKLTFVGQEKPNTISRFISQHSWRSKNLVDTAIISSPADVQEQIKLQISKIRAALENDDEVSFKDITVFFDLSTASLLLNKGSVSSLVFELVHIPFSIFTSAALKIATNVWLTIIKERRELAHILLAEVGYCWMETIDKRIGLFSRKFDLLREENQKMEYAPYDKKAIDRDAQVVSQSLQPHRHVISFFTSHFEGTSFQSEWLFKLFTQWVLHGLNNLVNASLHPFARMARNDLLNFALSVFNVHKRQNSKYVKILSKAIVNSGLSWFRRPMAWPFGSNQLKIKADLTSTTHLYSSLDKVSSLMASANGNRFRLLQYFLISEINHIETWLSPLHKNDIETAQEPTADLLKCAYEMDPRLAINFFERYRYKKFEEILFTLVLENPLKFVGVPEALDFYLTNKQTSKIKQGSHHVTYWCPVDPIKSINLFLPPWNTNTFILQYCVFSLEYHDVNVTFFYVPQITQCLRYDVRGYAERLILDTAKTNELFAHQIIWNMFANSYKGDEGVVEDDLKPKLDQVRSKIISTFSGSRYELYEREFGFFNEVTSISGKLKPYIKKSKAEKKHKIDEEMSKIEVKPNVYLPSNPDGVVVDIDRKSGKPLQSHAKAPFMATFKIRKTVTDSETGVKKEVEKWQAAIFKVGDDCRQDVLALQLISVFRTIWSNIGLSVYVFPNRVTATAPGCGVIDVLPNSISRDMLGREAVNGLYEYFVTKFGDESTIEFQNARNNFVKSLAAYSVISYLLQFKDRHNGNIMYDSQGHCLHIDFGFIFDIVPGGIKFEAVPFKLTKEMVRIMGGSQDTQAYHDFEELCIQAYLAARPHMDAIIECVKPMLESGLPCFKGIKTIKNLQNRFQPARTDHEAAMFMKSLIKKSYESLFTKGYDEFQRLTNGIPY